MSLQTLGYLPFENTPVNRGVESVEITGTSQGVSVNRVRYKCPISGDRFSFITNLQDVPPGLIAYLYKMRWDIEKTFDDIKNKLGEKKAWATSDVAKTTQAQFICIAYNLMLNLENQITNRAVENKTEDPRRKKRLKESLPKDGRVRSCSLSI